MDMHILIMLAAGFGVGFGAGLAAGFGLVLIAAGTSSKLST